MLELRKLLHRLEAVGQEAAQRKARYASLTEEALGVLASTPVDEALRARVEQAIRVDSSWRGAMPIEADLNAARSPAAPAENANLIAVDGSQIYPDHHGPVLYYLVNVGSIRLRQGSGQAPIVETAPELLFEEAALYGPGLEPITADDVNIKRDLAEMQTLARLAWEETQEAPERLVIAIKDGQLLMWQGERGQAGGDKKKVNAYVNELRAIERAGAVPVGYVVRPRSANVVRLLWVVGLAPEGITKESVREHKYRALTDRALFAQRLQPNQRSALFASTAEANRTDFEPAGQGICFFYLNVARPNEAAAQIARIDLPAWAAVQPELVDRVQNALYADCGGLGYPYVLSRADEMAVVSQAEKRDLDAMMAVQVTRETKDPPLPSAKAAQKITTRGYTS